MHLNYNYNNTLFILLKNPTLVKMLYFTVSQAMSEKKFSYPVSFVLVHLLLL